ncbi:carbohydrate ABC transporter permease [Neoroseomonas lacus]|uniref:Sugar ABC transporter permease n=1 Tax=Neoroseomonas lacus TaxID=287609 RepID=A0A917K8M4_9PROT|nr:carbohydrate ABC transporter permease [Neoroseomonas lacus]GGJ02853.1 sugar ABC transporter permease [Neoroseomonas lacus]
MSGRRLRSLAARALFALLLLVIVAYTVFPFFWAIVSSLKSGSALFSAELFPADPAWGNYAAVFRDRPFGRNILNSVVVAGSVVAVSLALGASAAFALGRVAFRGRGVMLAAILAVSMFPQVAVLSGLFELIRWLGLYNNLLSLVFSYLIFTLPFTVWVLTTFMREMPRELEEAAMIDGATPWVVLTRIFLPLMGPALATTGLLAFIAAWNEFLFALTFTLTDEMRTVPVAIALISGSSAFELPWGRIMAASVIVTVPLLVLVLVFQRRIVAGLMAGAVKG